jgi:hypothetical protein
LIDSLRRWARATPKWLRARHVLLLLILAGVLAHHVVFWNWFIEDAAISFAYARNLASGEGLVPFPGGERVEGYSNPTWVLLNVLPHLVGIDVFRFAKVVQLLLALSTTWLVYRTVRDATSEESPTALLAAAFLATSSQFALWGAAGLEGALLAWLIALALRRMGCEHRAGGTPWSALVWMLVALTRPEGILYAAVGGFVSLVSQRSVRSLVLWLLLFFVPWGLYQYWHYQYFAWPLPNTYYAKLGEKVSRRMVWTGGGWRMLRNFFHNLGLGYFLPVWLLGGLGDGRGRFGLAILAVLGAGTAIQMAEPQRLLLVVWLGCLWAAFAWTLRSTEDSPSALILGGTALSVGLIALTEGARALGHAPALVPVPDALDKTPPYVLTAIALLVPLVGWGGRARELRLACWLLCCSVLLYAVYVQEDWMKGFRWLSVAAVPGAVLFAFGVDSFVRFLEYTLAHDEIEPERHRSLSPQGTVLAAALLLAALPANVVHSYGITEAPDSSPQVVKVRVDYVEWVGRRLHLQERLVDLDVDQGAHLYWSDFEMMDFAGLVDLPFAHHHHEKAFVKEYLFEERRPHVAHVHGAWAQRTKIPTHPEWREQYVEIPPYITGRRSWHPGTFVRRDLILEEVGSEPVLRFANGLELHGLSIPSEPGEGRKMYVEVALGRGERPVGPFRALLFASDGERLASWELPPGYDWVTPEKWRAGEIFRGKFDLSLPAALVAGTYEVGLLLLDADGEVIPSAEPPTEPHGEPPSPPRLARGEVGPLATLTVLPLEQRGKAAVQDRREAHERAGALDCEGAEQSWQQALHHRAGERAWQTEHEPAMRAALATCWALSSDGQPDDQRLQRLVQARRWDHRAPEYRSRAPQVAQGLVEQGQRARAEGDWELAYRAFSDAVEVDPTQSWARRWAEEARAVRLGLH